MHKSEKQIAIVKLVATSDLPESEKKELLSYIEEHQKLIKDIIKQTADFSKANNILPFEYTEWVNRANELF